MRNEEERLIKRAQEGDVNAFRELVERHMKKMYYLCYDLTRNHHDAEDLSQEVFIKVFHSISKFRGESKFSSWIHRIAVNTFIDKGRRYKPVLDSFEEEFSEDENVVKPPVDQEPIHNPEKGAESGLIQKHLDHALKELPNQQRSVFVLRHYQQYSLKEIAELLKISEGSVKSSLFRAIRRLQESLSFYRYDLGLEESK